MRNLQDYRLFAMGEKKSHGRPWAILTSQEVAQTLGITLQQTARLFSRLLYQKRIQQLRRGLYLVPGRLPPGKIWSPSPYEALWAYMNWLGATWQITGLAAFVRYGFSTQVPQSFTVCNDKLSGKFACGGSHFVFIKLPRKKLGNITLFPMYGDLQIPFSSRARTIFDAIYFEKRFGALSAAYVWMAAIAKDSNETKELINCCLAYGNRQTLSRIGFVLEKLNVDVSLLVKKRQQQASKTLVPLVSDSRCGSIDHRWGIIENKSISEIFSALENPDENDT